MNLPRLPKLGYFYLLLCLLLTSFQVQLETDYAVHANIIYRFTKYIDWPDSKKSGDFIIGIVGDTPLYEELKNFIASKTVGKQRITIKKFSSSETSFTCHILFICQEESRSLKKIVAFTSGYPILVVTESAGLASRGSCINFLIIHEHLKLEINKTTIEQRDLSIANELLTLATTVK